MHVGASTIFQNPGSTRTDHDVYRNELRIAGLIEPLGFDSAWGVEHHFTDYTMLPDVMEFLAYMAGRTERIQLGSMVMVLPWHQPMRAAEQISMLDNLSDGRVILGLGRGSGRVEFDGFGLDMSESRQRFVEAATMVLEGLETGTCEFDGEFVKQSRADIRPFPFKTFRGRTYIGSLSPESAPMIAQLGAAIFVVPQKPWHRLDEEFASYRTQFAEIHGHPAPPPAFGAWVYCHEDEEVARERAFEYVGRYWDSTLEHYQFHTGHMSSQKGYEYYGAFAKTMDEKGPEAMLQHFVNLQVFGTPEQCAEKVKWIATHLGADLFTAVFSYGNMPYDLAEASMRLFAKDVLPELKQFSAAEARAAQAV
jgi:alkanesulfonate monooxygenase SsuD/methylene tetrahydromethanopterin reductase-like flavin-dependent oxidoreductase (luciferase family)